MNFKISDKSKSLKELLQFLIKKEFIIFCGAGISISPPTFAPSGLSIKREVLKAFFETLPDEWGLPNEYNLDFDDYQQITLFEGFLNLFDNFLFSVVEDWNATSINANHQIIAKLAKSGILKGCITLNFDNYIEYALNEENVKYELLIDDEHYENFLKSVRQKNLLEKFVLCKLHGTIDNPESISSLRSINKRINNLSEYKIKVLIWLLEQYFCLFLGCSGWDFIFSYFRRFWEQAAKLLKGIYWIHNIDESNGPNLQNIFSSCLDKVILSEIKLPEGLILALQQISIPEISLKGLQRSSTIQDKNKMNKDKKDRNEKYQKWAKKLPESYKLAAAITEGEFLSAKFRERTKKSLEVAKIYADYTGPDPKLQEELQSLSDKLQKSQISYEEFLDKNFKIILKMQLEPLREDIRKLVEDIFNENRYSGYTDDYTKGPQFLSKITSLLPKFKFNNAIEIALDLMRREDEALKKGEPYTVAESLLNSMYVSILHPEEELWRPSYNLMVKEKERYIKGEIDITQYQERLTNILTKSLTNQYGSVIPIDDLIEKLISVVASSPTSEEYKQNCEAFYLAMSIRYAYIHSVLVKTPEYQTIQKEAFKDHFTHFETEFVDQISNTEIKIDRHTLEKYDKVIREKFSPIIRAQQKFFKDEINESRILIEMVILSIWIVGTSYLSIESGKKYHQLWKDGHYPKVSSNISIAEYIWDKNNHWIEKALKDLPEKYALRLCFYLVSLSEQNDNFELCKRATLRALEYTNGIIHEGVFYNIPISLARFFQEKGDKENALKYYKLALEATKLAYPHILLDVAVYQTAKITAEKRDKEQALKIIGKFHPSFRGSVFAFASPARRLCEEFAEQLATELGYPNAHAALDALLE